jgi:hypothetical protein
MRETVRNNEQFDFLADVLNVNNGDNGAEEEGKDEGNNNAREEPPPLIPIGVPPLPVLVKTEEKEEEEKEKEEEEVVVEGDRKRSPEAIKLEEDDREVKRPMLDQ